MKRFIALVCIAVLPATAAFAQGSQQMIKQRAKNISNQNNAQQGVPPPSQPPAQQKPVQPAPPPLPAGVVKLQADFAAITAKPEIAPEQKQQLIKDLTAIEQGGGKPTQISVTAFANDLATAMAGKNLSAAQQLNLAQNVNAIFSNAALSQVQKEAVFDNVQVILQTGGATRTRAEAVVSDLKIVGFEIQKPATK